MTEIIFSRPPGKNLPQIGSFERWVLDCFEEIRRDSLDRYNLGRDFTVTNLTESRSLDASAATLAQLRDVVATLLADMKRGAQKRTK